MTGNEKTAVLTSGGLDSSVLLAEAAQGGRSIVPIYIHSGMIWEEAEIFWLRKFIIACDFSNVDPIVELHVPVVELYGRRHWSVSGENTPGRLSDDPEVFLPGRNLLFLAHASTYAALNGISEILLATLRGNPFADATPEFFRRMAEATRQALSREIVIGTPYRELTKHEVAGRGKGFPLHLTFSCLNPTGMEPCRNCNKCVEWEKVLKENDEIQA